MSAVEGQRLAHLSLSVLKKMHCDEDFSAFYELVLCDQSRVGTVRAKMKYAERTGLGPDFTPLSPFLQRSA